MPYQPNYCNHCGEKVERTDWKLWTSSRFCENCETALRKTEWLPKAGLASIAAIGAIYGFGSYLKSPEKPTGIVANQFTVSTSNKIQTAKNEQVLTNSNVQNATVKPTVQNNNGSPNQAKTQTTAPRQNGSETPQIAESETVYFCGAQTKKGTSCTRKVKRPERCWQHEGLPAMTAK
jgi:hypothetical protein